MKYKVIGWTNYDDTYVPTYNKTIGYAERNAIIDDIRKNKYLFTGWDHQESFEACVPILNDGKKREFSQRGWGGIMAEAYNCNEPYDYARFTFHESIDSKYKVYPNDDFILDECTLDAIENEHFILNVSNEFILNVKKKNIIVLSDLDEIRYIDTFDKLTLKAEDNIFTVIVKEVDRKRDIYGLEEVKVSIKYYPGDEVVYPKKPIIFEDINEAFKNCKKEYDFNVLLELFNYDIKDVTKGKKTKSDLSVLSRFVNDLKSYCFDEYLMIRLLKYIDDFELFRSVSKEFIKSRPIIYLEFINFYLDKGVNVDEYINQALKLCNGDTLFSKKIYLRAIKLNPNNKTLRMKFYRNSIGYSDFYSLSRCFTEYSYLILFGGNIFDKLRKEHKYLVELEDYSKFKSNDVLDVVELLCYPCDLYSKLDYVPKYYLEKEELLIDGIHKYQEYIKSKYDFDNKLEDFIVHGIYRRSINVSNKRMDINDFAEYVYKLDLLTNFKFNFKNKVISKYNCFSNLEEELDKLYN